MIRGLVTPVDYPRAERILLRRDAVLATLIRAHGPCGLADAHRLDHFSALARAIIFQQLSTKAASTIHGRLAALLPDGAVTATAIAALTDEQFRSAGVSRSSWVAGQYQSSSSDTSRNARASSKGGRPA